MTSVPSLQQLSNGNKAHLLRPIYLISKTPYPGVIHIPILTTRFFTPEINFAEYDGLIVTSKQILEALSGYSEEWKTLPIIAVSEETAEVFRSAGCTIGAVAQGYGKEIVPIVQEQFPAYHFLYLRPQSVASLWAQEARLAGIQVDEAVMYETGCNDDLPHEEIASDAVLVFTSPSSVKCFLKRYSFVPTHDAVAIGTTTAKALPQSIRIHISPETRVSTAIKMGREVAFSSPF